MSPLTFKSGMDAFRYEVETLAIPYIETNEMDDNENSFRKDDVGKTRFSLIPPSAHRAIADVLTYGANKYTPNNWCKCPEYSRYIDALERHINAWKAGERDDSESGLHHLAHAGCCLMFLLEFELSGLGVDDRICHDINAQRCKNKHETNLR